jgi:aminoglycoside phosphotransferase (APT) family kinase protein
VRPLGGGIAEATDALTIDDAAGLRHRLVLQRWIRPDWNTDDPGFDPAKEAAVLAVLEPTVIPAPRLVAVDPDGSRAGVATLLTERLPGRPPSLTQTARPDLWREALAIAGSTPPRAAAAILIHRDYHAGNTLWVADRLTGVVDWTSASWGPPAADLGHLRVDLAVDVSVAAAVMARGAFVAAGGDLTNAQHHQMRSVFDYLTDRDPSSVDAATAARLDAFLEVVMHEPDRTG